MVGRGLYAVPGICPASRKDGCGVEAATRSNPRRMRPNAASIADAPDEEPALPQTAAACVRYRSRQAPRQPQSQRTREASVMQAGNTIPELPGPTAFPAKCQRARPRLGSHEGTLATYPQRWGVLGTGR